MCGITGIWPISSSSDLDLSLMLGALMHRGPDAKGFWFDKNTQIGLAHSRLSILDLSPAGHQPMISPCGCFVLVFNGEIYNHLDLRQALEKDGGAFNWKGKSDSETLLAGLRHWGVETCLKKLNGMFAFALWDRTKQKLYLARDRMGEKPLYYGHSASTFVFASELKAITAHSKWHGKINREALAMFMRYSHVPSPFSIYNGIKKIPPAHYVVISDQGKEVSPPKCYWSLAGLFDSDINQSQSSDVSSETLIEELDQILRDAVGLRMLADVPLGAFLSGGYDSTMIVAQMQTISSKPVKTFTIGNENIDLDEAKHAAKIAKHLGTDHSYLYITPQDALSVIPKMPQIFDEPFADSSQIPTFLVSRLARRDVTVVLSGDGGDELFGGYNRHVFGPRIWRIASRMPQGIRRMLSYQISRIAKWEVSSYRKYIPNHLRFSDLELKLSKLANALKADDDLEFYDQFRAHWQENNIVLGCSVNLPFTSLPNVKLLEQMIYQDMHTYLPDDILTKIDRASMAVSLEARAPFLDHRLVEFASRVPSQFKVRNGKGKWLLREALCRYVPRKLMKRPKQGFGIPIDQWLRGSLRDWAESLLSESRLQQEGYLNTKLVRSVWEDHCAGRGNREHDLWCVLMFQSWLESQN
jgi:asparagine synthase (glutamine-hydrolysing)